MVEDRMRADNGVDNILELYEKTLKHSTATGTLTKEFTNNKNSFKPEDRRETTNPKGGGGS